MALLTSAAVPMFTGPGSSGGSETAGFDDIDRTPQLPPVLPAPDPTIGPPVGGETDAHSIKAPKPKPKEPSKKPTKNPPAESPADYVTYENWNGPRCSAPSGGGYRTIGEYGDGRAGWYTILRFGGHNGDGCDGSFTAVPMSGSKTQDGGARVLWWWSVGSESERCTIEVHIPPWTGNSDDVAGDPTHYEVLSDPKDLNSRYAGFQISQVSNRGRLVDVGTFDVQDGVIAVLMLDRGQDWGNEDRDLAHHAAAQIKVTCRS